MQYMTFTKSSKLLKFIKLTAYFRMSHKCCTFKAWNKSYSLRSVIRAACSGVVVCGTYWRSWPWLLLPLRRSAKCFVIVLRHRTVRPESTAGTSFMVKLSVSSILTFTSLHWLCVMSTTQTQRYKHINLVALWSDGSFDESWLGLARVFVGPKYEQWKFPIYIIMVHCYGRI